MSKIIKKLENNQQRDIKNVAQTMAIAADLVEKQKLMIEALSDLIPENATTFTSNNGKKSIEERLEKLEQAVIKIIAHLQLKI